jgi:YHS domain-containing protein
MARDPVCSMHVEETTPFITEYEGARYYFCSEGCKKSLIENRKSTPIRTRGLLKDIKTAISGELS